MYSKQIVDSDDFLDMPLSAQALYLHLLVRADDDGFTNGTKKIMRMIGARDDDLKVLIGKNFIILFESGVLVIKHWLIHNSIRKDRYKPTVHNDEKKLIEIKENNSYTLKKEPLDGLDTEWQPIGNQMDTQVRLGKVSIGKNNKPPSIPPKGGNEESEKIPYKEIVEYLNLKTKSKYKHTTKKTKSLISARFNEGFTKDDFFKAIDNAFAFRMAQDGDLSNMKPSILFNGTFEERVSNDAYAWFYNKGKSNQSEFSGRYKNE
jgi:uncharacterized phage protein (TIGR02220 family)